MKKKIKNTNRNFSESAICNDLTYLDYLNRFKKIAISIFEWENLPKSMSSRYLEECLFYDGKASIIDTEDMGFVNTRCASNGYVNLYNLPSKLHCFSNGGLVDYDRKLYIGMDQEDKSQAILVMNNYDMIPTASTLELFAYRLYEAEQTAMTNIRAQKTPIMITVDEKQRLMMENLFSQYDGNTPVIFGDKNQLQDGILKVLKTDAPFIADKVMEYKKQIWNECLTFLGINNIDVEKKERLISGEATSNNELINMNLQSYLAPRKQACREFNELFGLTGTDKEINVRVRSDLFNIIKTNESIITDYNMNGVPDDEEGVTNG